MIQSLVYIAASIDSISCYSNMAIMKRHLQGMKHILKFSQQDQGWGLGVEPQERFLINMPFSLATNRRNTLLMVKDIQM